MRRPSAHRAPRHAERGVAAVEFALILPAFLLIMLGGIEIGHLFYLRNVLRGELERAARASSLESAPGDVSTIDARVTDIVRKVTPTATVDFQRRAYQSYTEARDRAEPFTDSNGDHQCDNGEVFTDLNANGHWDADAGVDGVGGARQISVYDVTVRFAPLFPFMAHLLNTSLFTVKTSTQLRNQPYSAGSTPATGVCA